MRSRLAIWCSLHRRLCLVGDPRSTCRAGQSSSPRYRGVRARTKSGTLSLVSFGGAGGAASCTLQGRPCNPQYSPCCRGLRCVFRGGSTRVGYQCFRAASANASTSSFWEKLSANKLDHDDLTEVLW